MSSTHQTSYDYTESSCASCDYSLAEVSMSSSDKAKTVRFNPRVRARKALHIADYTFREKEACYYDSNELDDIKAATRHAVESASEEFNTLRGLENQTKTGDDQPVNEGIQRSSRWAVFREQQKQRALGSHDPSEIAAVYAKVAEACQTQAQDRAAADQVEASQWLSSTEVTKKEVILGDVNVCSDRSATLLARRKLEMMRVACRAA